MTTADELWVQLKQAERDLASRASLYEAGVCSEDQFRERVQIYRAARAAYLEHSGIDWRDQPPPRMHGHRDFGHPVAGCAACAGRGPRGHDTTATGDSYDA